MDAVHDLCIGDPMKEITVETTGNFMLVDRFSGKEIPVVGAVTVPLTPFIQERLDNGDLIELGLDALEGLDIDPEAAEAEDDDVEGGVTISADMISVGTISASPLVSSETEAQVDADGDGHDDKTGQFVEGNTEAPAKPKRGRK
jgi:hypothetical protein